MTINSDSSELLDGDASRAGLFARGFDTEVNGHSNSDELLNNWPRAEDTEGSDPDNFYDMMLRRRIEETSGDRSIFDNSQWRSQSEGFGDAVAHLSRTSPVGPAISPSINDEIYGFRLLSELGKGSFAKVYLAKQGNLADREVVLKISAIEGTEPQTLAQLQHTHVVPIYSVHEDAQFGLRAVCMPYFGGASLNKVLKEVWTDTVIPATGKSLIDALDRVSGPKPEVRSSHQSEEVDESIPEGPVETAQTARVVLTGMPYVQATAWIIARLAEGLQHSHERNVIHRDIKPSNILLSSEGQPLLLDFNVSQALDCDPNESTVGGTVAYMSPEQMRAMRDRTATSSALVNRRSDIYSLGLVLYEMLAGATPFSNPVAALNDTHRLDPFIRQREQSTPSLKATCLLDIPWSLESIVRKTLAPNPADRYASAGQLAEDLNRFLQDLPLKFAPELSRAEQLRKWGRRHPRLMTAGWVTLIAVILMIPVGVALHLAHDNLASTTRRLDDAEADKRAYTFQENAQEALCKVKVSPNEGASRLDESLLNGIAATKEVLSLYHVNQDPEWQNDRYWQRLEANKRAELADTIRELLLELASAQVYIEKENLNRASLEALSLVETAGRIRDLQPSRALEIDRARYLSLLKREAEAQRVLAAARKIPLTSAHDHYMLAAAHTRMRTPQGYREAIRLLTISISMSPKHYWSHFQRALCHQELREDVLAVSDLGTCTGLWPKSTWAHFNRGYLFSRLGKKSQAIDDYTTVIKHNPQFHSAYFNRALLHLELQNYDAALVDFQKVQESGRNDANLDAARAMALEGVGKQAEAELLFARVVQPDKKLLTEATIRFSWTYAFAVAHRAPTFSHKLFDSVLRARPQHPEALYGKGMLKMREGKLKEAVRFFDQALNADSTFIEPLRYRAVALARLGQLQQAGLDAKGCIEREPTNPDSLYIATCVTAIAARQHPELIDSAIDLLRKAIEHGVNRERPQTDPDLSALRGHPEFIKLLGGESEQPEPIPADSDSF